MARAKPNFLWRAMPTPRSVVDTCELQTLAYDSNTKKPEWLTVARGEPNAVEIIAARLSRDRFRMFPLRENEPGWPKEEGGMVDDDEEQDENNPRRSQEAGDSDEAAEGKGEFLPEEAGGALSGSTTTVRRPAIRETQPRRTLTGAAARSHQKRRERDEGRDGRDTRS